MYNVELEQLFEKFPYLRKMAETTIFEHQEVVKAMKNGEQIDVDKDSVSIEFLTKILTDEKYYDYACRFFKDEIRNFSVSYIINGDTAGNIYYNKSTIINGINKLISEKKLELTQEQIAKFENLKQFSSFEKFKSDFYEKSYSVTIDNNDYVIPIDRLMTIMTMSDQDFDELCSNEQIRVYDGIPKEHFIYAALKCLGANHFFDKYSFPQNIINRYNDIHSLQKIDLQSLDKLLETLDTKYKEVKLDEGLKHEIISGMPYEATDLEKAIYIYIKMCKVLTYDDEYYAVNQKGVATIKHKNVEYVSTITPENNKVVCFEFNLIYSKILNELGINFKSDYKNMLEDSYGEGHADLEFRSGKFLVQADSVTSILQGDMMQAKLNQKLVGLTCKNRNQQTQQEFRDTITKMYRMIVEQEQKLDDISKVEHTETLEELLYEYSKSTDNLKSIGLNEKLSILVDKVNSKKMVGIDSLSYLLQLRKVLFTNDERKNNIGISVVRNNHPDDIEKVAMACAIISLNPQSFDELPESNLYYYFQPNMQLTQITQEQLQGMFNSGMLEYIEKDDPRIPNISESVGMNK